MSWMLAICMHIATRALCAAHACVFIMHALCAVDHACIPQNSVMPAHCIDVMHARVFIRWPVTVGRQDKLSTRCMHANRSGTHACGACASKIHDFLLHVQLGPWCKSDHFFSLQ